MRKLFFYGTLRDPDLLAVVLNRPVKDIEITPAQLPGFEICAVKGREFPFARADEGCVADGILVSGLSPEDVERLIYYEGAYLYALEPVLLVVDAAEIKAEVFVSDYAGWQPDGLWSLSAWIEQDQGVSVEAAGEVMSCFGIYPAEKVFEHYPTIRQRAQSRLRACDGAPRELRSDLSSLDVTTHAVRQPYLSYFAVEERDLQFRKFDGRLSEPVKRAAFLAADAVTVLPYDPVLDQVLLIEQLRVGPLMRGDPHPWCLEPVAGRVDSGESYEQTAHREAHEETGLTLSALEFVARYYPSPGAFSEYLVSYVGIADLSDRKDSVFGLESEHEDIRTLTIPFATLMEAVTSGEAETAPLVLTALWLARNRARLRQTYGGA